MILRCPNCSARYRIDPAKAQSTAVRIKCPKCKTSFTSKLSAEAGPGEDRIPAIETSAEVSGRKVLVVEDARFFRELVLDVLKPLELELMTADDGNEGLAVILREKPALVILDLNLPGRNGYTLIKDIRSRPELADTRILAISAVYRTQEDHLTAEKAGADDFISKSFKPEFLQQRVRTLLLTGK